MQAGNFSSATFLGLQQLTADTNSAPNKDIHIIQIDMVSSATSALVSAQQQQHAGSSTINLTLDATN